MPLTEHELEPVGRDAASYNVERLSTFATDKSDVEFLADEKLHELASVTSQYARYGEEFEVEEPVDKSQEKVLETAEDFSRALVSSEDDPNLPIHTFRMWFTGLGLAVFGAVLGMLFVSAVICVSCPQWKAIQLFASNSDHKSSPSQHCSFNCSHTCSDVSSRRPFRVLAVAGTATTGFGIS